MSGALALLTQILSGELHGDPDEFNRKWGAFKPNHREGIDFLSLSLFVKLTFAILGLLPVKVEKGFILGI